MLFDVAGRNWTESTADELERQIEEQLSRLAPEEQGLIREMLREAQCGRMDMVEALTNAHYKSALVPVRQFILDPYYLGETCDGTYEVLIRDLEELFVGNYCIVIYTGAIGSGKTHVSSLGMIRVLYQLMQMRNPQRSFKLSADTPIVQIVFSATKQLAEEVAFAAIVGKILASPYFKENAPFKHYKRKLHFPHNVQLITRASTGHSALGMAVVSALEDEGDFIDKKVRKVDKRFSVPDKAKVLTDSIVRRMQSRFGKHGKLFLPCSKTTRDSFVQKMVRLAEKDPTVFVRDYAKWDVCPDAFSKKRFKVLVGNELIRSRILTGEEAASITDLPERTVVIDVPEDCRAEFELDLEGCLAEGTRISLLDGREIRIEDLVGQDEFWTYSYGPDGRLYPGRGYDARCVGEAPVLEVVLDNGETVVCTPKHPFMRRDGTYACADELAAGDSLMPLYRRKCRHGYEMVRSNVGGRWVHTHKIISREAHSAGIKPPDGHIVHHRNFVRTDNRPSNLEILSFEEHKERHAGFACALHTPEMKAKGLHARWCAGEFESCIRCQTALADRFPNNHKVVSVTALGGTRPVYDISVEKWNNFALSAGVVVHNSIRDVAGIATVAVSPFIQRIEKIETAVDPAREHPFTVLRFDPSAGGEFIWDRLARKVQRRVSYTETVDHWEPLVDPEAPRAVHIDPALNNCSAGFCMAHICDWKTVLRSDHNLKQYSEHAPVFWVDFVLEIVPPAGSDLDFALFRSLVYQLSDHGFNIKWVTLDQFQSRDTIQQLEKKGFETDLVSMDTTWNPYQNVKTALYEGRVNYYKYSPLQDELRNLQADWGRRRVFTDVSKDVSDAFSGCLFSLLQHKNKVLDVPIMFGNNSFAPADTGYKPAAPKDRGEISPFLVG